MRRYILHVRGDYSGGYLDCTVDDLDDIIGDEEHEAIDTHTGEMYFYKDDAWVKSGNADDVKPGYLRRKSDPPVEPKPEPKEVEGGALIPPGFKKMILTRTPVVTEWVPYSATIRGIDFEIPYLDKT